MVLQRVLSQPPGPLYSKDVLYIGSAVPLETSEGIDAIQQPLRCRYPVHDEESIQGILSTLTVTPSGLQLRYKSDPSHVVFFPFSSLSLCAAVRCVKTTNTATNEVTSRFVSLTQAAADGVQTDRPAIFTTITRRTKGRQVLECHGFITVTPSDAMDLVQWTSSYDKKYKSTNGASGGSFMQMNGATTSGAALNTTHEYNRADTSFRHETASLPEFPVNLVAGEPLVHTAAQGFYNEAPKEGYFYSTKKAQVKKFSLHKFTAGAEEETGGIGEAAFSDHLDSPRPAYAGSHVSLPVSHHPPPMMAPRPVPVVHHPPPPPPPVMVAPRPPLYPHPMVRPVLVAGRPPPPPMIFARPRFFSPPPPPAMMRAQPVPVFVQHPAYNGVPRARSKSREHGSRHSSSSSSSSTSSDRGNRTSKKHHHHQQHQQHHLHHQHHKHTTHAHEDSSLPSSRPTTPPTDYESAPPRAGRMSRKDEHHLHQSFLREMNGPNRGAMTMWPPGRKPQGYYVVPVNNVYGAPTMVRARSVPPQASKSSKKDKKSKKKKSSKKNKSKKAISAIEAVPDPEPEFVLRQPDFQTVENLGYERSFSRSAAERAFSKSLAAETRNSGHTDSFNAYAMNQNGVGEAEFPVMY